MPGFVILSEAKDQFGQKFCLEPKQTLKDVDPSLRSG
jgi:hypothetical protein